MRRRDPFGVLGDLTVALRASGVEGTGGSVLISFGSGLRERCGCDADCWKGGRISADGRVCSAELCLRRLPDRPI